MIFQTVLSSRQGAGLSSLYACPPTSQWGECRWRRQIGNLTWKPLQLARWLENQGELENIFQTFPPQKDCQTTWMWPDTVVEKDKAVPFRVPFLRLPQEEDEGSLPELP